MIQKLQHLREDHITFIMDGQWYCIPYIMLSDLPLGHPLMIEVFKNLGFSGNFKKDANYYHILDRGIYNLIRDFFSKHEDPFTEITKLIKSNQEHFTAILNSCKLY
jgi:hypothetical protein